MTQISEQFAALHAQLRAELSPSALTMLDTLLRLRPGPRKTRGFADLGDAVTAPLERAAQDPQASLIARALISGLAVDVDARMDAEGITPFIAGASREWQTRLHRYLAEDAGEDYKFPSGEFVKDYRFVHAMSVPFGVQVVDLREGIGPKTALKLARKAPAMAWRAWRGTSLRFHVENRWLDDFNPQAWEVFYSHVADLLEAKPDVVAMVSTSWFFDPALADVSPRLAYLIGYPLSGGAQIVRHYTTDFDIASATATSATRRTKYEAGEYLPVSYSFVWERDDLIAWARERERLRAAG